MFLAKKLCFKIEKIACEPLTFRTHYYYSTYWVDYVFSKEKRSSRWGNLILHRSLARAFEFLFEGLAVLGIRSFPLLKGQALYVLMTIQGKE